MTNLKILIGEFGGEKVFFSPEIDYVFCKEHSFSLDSLTECMKNSLDRQEVPDASIEVILEKRPNNVIVLGCLEDSLETYKTLVGNIKLIKKQEQNKLVSK